MFSRLLSNDKSVFRLHPCVKSDKTDNINFYD